MERDILMFLVLKNKVAESFLKDNLASSTDITKWKGRDITNFQKSLLAKVKAQVSEKWFYTYFKNEKLEKIPRIDILNILSEYVGEKDWAAFVDEINKNELNKQEANTFIAEEISSEKIKQTNYTEIKQLTPVLDEISIKEPKIEETIIKRGLEPKENLKNKAKKKLFIIGGSIAAFFLLLVPILYVMEILPLKYSYEFCFIDSDRNKPITTPLEITLLQEGESPLHYKADENGCFFIKLKDNKIKLVVNSPYYKQDTIYRLIKSKYHNEKVELKTDDYALMLYYFSHSKVEDWKRRRRELYKMIANNAVIYQVFGNESYGVDILTKEDFINKLTLPTSSLKNLNVIETERKNNKIVKLKFEVISDEK